MRIRPITNKDHNTCHNCGQSFDNMYIIEPYEYGTLYARPLEDIVLCINCLFELQLRINDIFQLNNLTMLDGTDKLLAPVIFQDIAEMPQYVFKELKQGRRTSAIKKCGLKYNIGLFYASHLVNSWYIKILEANMEDHDIFQDPDHKLRYIKKLKNSVKSSTEKLAKEPNLKLTGKEWERTENA